MSSKRNSLYLYDDTDPSKVFSIANSAGVVTMTVSPTEHMTISGNSTFVGTDTSVTRAAADGSLSDHTLESLFDSLDLSVATNAANISAEETRATNAEGVLDTKIDNEVAALQTADSTNLTTALNAVAAQASAAAIAEGILQSNIDAEVTRATDAETSLSDAVTALANTEAANETTQNNALAAEVSRATIAEGNIQSDVDANETAFNSALSTAEAALQADINTNATGIEDQTSNAQAAEAGLQTQLTNLLSNVDGVALNSLQEIVNHFDGNDDTHMNLLGLLMNKVLQINSVLDTTLDPDLPALDAVLQQHFDSNLCLVSLTGSGAHGSSFASALGDGVGHTSSSHSMQYFLNTPFTITYDLTQSVTYDSEGVATVRDFDYVTQDLFISQGIALGTFADYAAGQAAWNTAFAANGNDAGLAYASVYTVTPTQGMQAAINAAYGFVPADITKVPLPYNDPGNYMLQVGLYGERPIFKGNEVSYEPFVGWKLTYCTAAGDPSTAYTDILSGTQSGNTLTISSMADGSGVVKAVEYPVSGHSILGERYGVFISDMTELTSVSA